MFTVILLLENKTRSQVLVLARNFTLEMSNSVISRKSVTCTSKSVPRKWLRYNSTISSKFAQTKKIWRRN